VATSSGKLRLFQMRQQQLLTRLQISSNLWNLCSLLQIMISNFYAHNLFGACSHLLATVHTLVDRVLPLPLQGAMSATMCRLKRSYDATYHCSTARTSNTKRKVIIGAIPIIQFVILPGWLMAFIYIKMKWFKFWVLWTTIVLSLLLEAIDAMFVAFILRTIEGYFV